MGVTGCDIPESAKGAKSILALSQPMSPEMAAQMALDPYNADDRAKGTMLLANAYFGGEDVYHRLYLERLEDEDPNVRAAALRGLALHGQPEDVPAIVKHLADDNARVRLEAVRALQRIHNPVAIDALIVSTKQPVPASKERTGDSEPDIRAAAAIALGQYADPRVVLPLIEAMDDPYLSVNLAAQQSLHTLTGEDFGLDRNAWVRWYDKTKNVFANRQPYVYPVFERDRKFWEYIPFVPQPPNESAGPPAGMPLEQ